MNHKITVNACDIERIESGQKSYIITTVSADYQVGDSVDLQVCIEHLFSNDTDIIHRNFEITHINSSFSHNTILSIKKKDK